MNSRSFLRPILFAALVSAIAVDADAREQKKSGAPKEKPALQVDSTPISDGRAGVVMSYADVVEPVQKTVVSIYSTKKIKERIRTNPLFRQFFPHLPPEERESIQEGLGSGVIVSADGYIITNNHVVEGADELKVSLSDEREYVAAVIGTDPKTDIAVIKIQADKLPVVTLADSDKLRVGDVVFAVGNPLGVGQTVTMGIVSAKGRSVGILGDIGGYEDYIQTDAAINMGNSGGALVDARGRLVGVNSAILSPSRGNIGIGFAIPVNLAASIMNSLIETGTVARGYLGVSTESVTPDIAEQLGLARETRGVVISDIIPGSAAEKAGLKRTDVVLAVNEHPVSTLEELRLLIAQMTPGTVARLKVVRDGRERMMNVTLDKAADKPDELFSGVTVKPLTPEDRRRLNIDPRVNGLLITDVAEDSPFRNQLLANAVIMEINRMAVSDLAAAKEALLLQPSRALLAIYLRGSVRFVVVAK
ncbi:MAG: Do family serine endopeptidase [Verrucomicrobia bacterium]|nr:Do family serine endopeptidase [Verrucomicrobiota bacterium]